MAVITEVSVPSYIDDPVLVLWFEIDEIVVVSSFVMLGILIEHLLPSLIISFFFVWRFKAFKTTRLQGSLLHQAFWYGFLALNKKFKNGLLREYIG